MRRYKFTYSHSRSETWPLMKSPFPMLSIIFSYMYFVKVLGPAYMKDRPAFQINKLVIAYNIVMVVLSSFFFVYGGSITYFSGKYNIICQPIDYSLEENAMKFVYLGWWFLLLKIAEFSDTIFFILRKKFSQVSVLHVAHHSLVAWGVWVGLKFGAGGHNVFFPFINCFVHTIMYSYYCLSALGPSVRKYLWWKKYLTILQMLQFIVALIHAFIPLVIDCGFQPFFAYLLMGHAIFFYVMFYNFYTNSYSTDKQHTNGHIYHNDNCYDCRKYKSKKTK
ncbi:elongation of very long chain fatty acids protein-like protein [Leptotrombidium deliense]|uniref:Elongation of very long chain fatty acids protein n=1 Tax=Leptotrombidium deliense TaxID=299467 RepID=A0A443SI30_9ACAR|nr:elongation of very long chain fatty acids protein-like protein [Leptotrombidium deliense]